LLKKFFSNKIVRNEGTNFKFKLEKAGGVTEEIGESSSSSSFLSSDESVMDEIMIGNPLKDQSDNSPEIKKPGDKPLDFSTTSTDKVIPYKSVLRSKMRKNVLFEIQSEQSEDEYKTPAVYKTMALPSPRLPKPKVSEIISNNDFRRRLLSP